MRSSPSIALIFALAASCSNGQGRPPAPDTAAAQVTVTTLAGNGTQGFVDGTGGPHGTSEFHDPAGVALGGAFLFVADFRNNRVRRVALADGTTTTLTGNGGAGFFDGTGGASGTTELNGPVGLARDASGSLYVSDAGNNRIRKVDAAGNTTTFAGNGTIGASDGSGGPTGTAEFEAPDGLCFDPSGILYVVDRFNFRLRRLGTDGTTQTFSGSGAKGFADGPSDACAYNFPAGCVFSGATLLLADAGNNRIRSVDGAGAASTLAGNGTAGLVDAAIGASAELSAPIGLALDPSGNLYVSDGANNAIRLVSPSGATTTIAGTGAPGFADGPAGQAEFNGPQGLALDGAGVLYVGDGYNNRIRAIHLH